MFLNNLCLRDEKLDHYCVQFARTRELFLAARDCGVHVLVYGSMQGFNLVDELIPALPDDTPQIIYFKVTLFCLLHS